MHIDQRLEFIRSLPALQTSAIRKFADMSDETPTPPGDTNEAAASVSADNINIYMPGVSDSIVSDVNLCKLVMQNAADIEFPRDDQQAAWFDYYIDGLKGFGWIMQAKVIQDVEIKGVNLSMDEVALSVIKDLIGDKATLLANLAKRVISQVQGDSKLVELFSSNQKIGKQSKFDITPAWVDNKGQANMVLNSIYLDARESTTNILFWKTTKKSTLIQSGAVHTYLDNSTFNDLRSVLREEFLEDAKSKIKNLPRLKKQ